MEAPLGGFLIRGWTGLYSIAREADQLVVLVASGRVEVTDRQGQFTLVTEGERFTAKSGAPRGEVAPFDPRRERWK